MATLQEFKTALYGEGYDPSSFKVSRMVGTSLPTAFLKMPHVHAVVKAYYQDLSLPLEEFPLHESVELTLSYFLLFLVRLPTPWKVRLKSKFFHPKSMFPPKL